ncbi:MAG: hypothetical protein M3Q42_04565 [Pseudomonadota bacterium]|nr:hypothetical protein [Pseudomonadota bacterium]
MERATEEMLCEIQAQLYSMRVVLRALARTHPDPAALLDAWRSASTEAARVSEAPWDCRHSDYLAERMCACAEDWTAEFVEFAIPASTAPRAD